MTIELSLVPASPDGNCLELIPRDVTGMPDIDRLRHLQEGAESSYTSLFAFGRQPGKKSNAEDIMRSPEYPSGGVFPEDLEPLRNFQSGVYILINTRSKSQARLSVFAGMAGIDERTVDSYLERTGADPGIIDVDCYQWLSQCLENKAEQPPSKMKNWDVAIAIPTQSGTDAYFEELCNILDNIKEFLPQHKRPPKNYSSRNRKIRKNMASGNVHNFEPITSSIIAIIGIKTIVPLIGSLITSVGSAIIVAWLLELVRKKSGNEESISSSANQSSQSKTESEINRGDTSKIEIYNDTGIVNIYFPPGTYRQSRSDDFEK